MTLSLTEGSGTFVQSFPAGRVELLWNAPAEAYYIEESRPAPTRVSDSSKSTSWRQSADCVAVHIAAPDGGQENA